MYDLSHNLARFKSGQPTLKQVGCWNWVVTCMPFSASVKGDDDKALSSEMADEHDMVCTNLTVK